MRCHCLLHIGPNSSPWGHVYEALHRFEDAHCFDFLLPPNISPWLNTMVVTFIANNLAVWPNSAGGKLTFAPCGVGQGSLLK